MEENSNGEQPAPAALPIVQPVIEAGSAVVQPVVDHAAKIAAIEERESQRQVEHARELAELEERLRSATGNQLDSILERIGKIEEAQAASAQAAAEEIADKEGVELAIPEVENSPAPPERIRQGMRHRRKARKAGNK